MKYLLDEWPRIKSKIKKKRIILLLDYDGTLSVIVSKPSKTTPNKEIKLILKSLAKKKNIYLAIVSGRKLKDVEKLIQIKGIWYVGNHGLEMKSPASKLIYPRGTQFKRLMKEIKKKLNKKIRKIKGALIEDKALTLTLHYRAVRKKDLYNLKEIFGIICNPYLRAKRIKIRQGKKCWEIRPPLNWDKGKAVKKILSSFKRKTPFPIYLGDDTTDEDAFRVVKKKGLAVFIGKPKHSYADYFLNSVSEVKRFLERIEKAL